MSEHCPCLAAPRLATKFLADYIPLRLARCEGRFHEYERRVDLASRINGRRTSAQAPIALSA
jgi:hypothetical protein